MAEKHGSINWTELWTSDGKAAQEFYAKLCGWTYEPMPGSESSYMLAKSGGETICGVFEWKDPQSDRWFTHFTVDDTDKAVATAVKAGGSIVKPAFDIPGVGRVAILKDISGTSVGVIKPE